MVAAIGAGLILRYIHEAGWEGSQRFLGYAGAVVAYIVAAVVVFVAIPGNPDPIPDWVPDALIVMFRTFSIIGHLLLWLTIALGVSGYIRYKERGISATAGQGAEGNMEPASRQ